MQDPGFWSDQLLAKSKSQKLNLLKTEMQDWNRLVKESGELLELAQMAQREPYTKLKADLEAKFEDLKVLFEQVRIKTFLAGIYDNHNAIMSIHAGAGGLDAQDWANMLLRMYLRYAETQNFVVEILDESKGAEGGIKSVVLEIKGHYAYGYLKSEAGVHRLVRLSPFNPTHTRETSFALVEVLPVVEETEFKLNMSEVDIEAKTSRGHGGQSVNTTYSAIRVVHKPTGTTVTIQNERSQMQNKEQALKILASKIVVLEEEKRRQEKLLLRGEFHSAEWGNQIRSYVLHPYKLVKDHRTNFETSDAEKVLNGELDEFIKNYLESNRTKN